MVFVLQTDNACHPTLVPPSSNHSNSVQSVEDRQPPAYQQKGQNTKSSSHSLPERPLPPACLGHLKNLLTITQNCYQRWMQLPTSIPNLMASCSPTGLRGFVLCEASSSSVRSEADIFVWCRGTRLLSVVFRATLLAILRSKRMEGAAIGIMITASHNPEPVSSRSS